ncbi:uncharacterized protein LOC144230082 [Crocuta crocuta]
MVFLESGAGGQERILEDVFGAKRARQSTSKRETQNLKESPGSELSAQGPMRGSNLLTVNPGKHLYIQLLHPDATCIACCFGSLSRKELVPKVDMEEGDGGICT